MRIVIAAALAAVVSLAPQRSADIVIVNARIFTGVSAQPWAEALAVSGTRISAVGNASDLKPFTGPSTRTIDAQGRLIVPGINDAHAHLTAMPGATTLDGPPAVQHDPTLDEVIGRVKAAAAKASAGTWLLGEVGAIVLNDARTTRAAFDAITGDRPMLLQAWTGHGVVFNSAALRAVGLTESEPDPPGGVFGRSSDGKLTGVAHEYAGYRFVRAVAALAGRDARIRAFREYASAAAGFGITSTQLMMSGYSTAEVLPLLDAAQLPLRLRVVDFPMTTPGTWSAPSPDGTRSPLITVSGVKWILDGTPVERGAFMRAPYTDAGTTRGRLNFSEPDLRQFLTRALQARTQPMFHAVGDGAIGAVLDALEATGGERWQALRPRIEHGDLLGPGDVERLRRFGVVVVQNPSHFMIGPLMQERFGAERAARSESVKTLTEAGVPFAIGSDGPTNPFLNMMFAAINQANPAQALTIEQSLVAYTRGSAYAEFAEKDRGTLAPGMLADFAMLSQDIFKTPVPDLPRTTSLLTVVNGRVVHEAR